MRTGTSTRGPMTAAKAMPELMPKTATATAMASSKLLEAAVKGERGGLSVMGAHFAAHVEGDEEHDDEIDEQRNGDPNHVERNLHDVLALEGEHDEDGEEQGDQGDGADLRDESLVIPLLVLHIDEDEPGDHPGDERNAEIDEDALGDLADGDVDDHALETEHGRQHGDEDVGVDREEEHLEDGVEGHESGAVLGIAFGQVVPDNDHGDAPGKADHDEADHVLGVAPAGTGWPERT